RPREPDRAGKGRRLGEGRRRRGVARLVARRGHARDRSSVGQGVARYARGSEARVGRGLGCNRGDTPVIALPSPAPRQNDPVAAPGSGGLSPVNAERRRGLAERRRIFVAERDPAGVHVRRSSNSSISGGANPRIGTSPTPIPSSASIAPLRSII